MPNIENKWCYKQEYQFTLKKYYKICEMNQNVNIGRSVHFLPLGKLGRKPNYTQKVILHIWDLNKTN